MKEKGNKNMGTHAIEKNKNKRGTVAAVALPVLAVAGVMGSTASAYAEEAPVNNAAVDNTSTETSPESASQQSAAVSVSAESETPASGRRAADITYYGAPTAESWVAGSISDGPLSVGVSALKGATVTASSLPKGVTFDAETGVFTMDPDVAGVEDGDIVTVGYHINEGELGGEETGSVQFLWYSGTVADDTAETTGVSGIATTVDVLANDEDVTGDILFGNGESTFEGQYGTWTVQDGKVVYTANGKGNSGDTDSVKYTVGGRAMTAKVTVTVTEDNSTDDGSGTGGGSEGGSSGTGTGTGGGTDGGSGSGSGSGSNGSNSGSTGTDTGSNTGTDTGSGGTNTGETDPAPTEPAPTVVNPDGDSEEVISTAGSAATSVNPEAYTSSESVTPLIDRTVSYSASASLNPTSVEESPSVNETESVNPDTDSLAEGSSSLYGDQQSSDLTWQTSDNKGSGTGWLLPSGLVIAAAGAAGGGWWLAAGRRRRREQN